MEISKKKKKNKKRTKKEKKEKKKKTYFEDVSYELKCWHILFRIPAQHPHLLRYFNLHLLSYCIHRIIFCNHNDSWKHDNDCKICNITIDENICVWIRCQNKRVFFRWKLWLCQRTQRKLYREFICTGITI